MGRVLLLGTIAALYCALGGSDVAARDGAQVTLPLRIHVANSEGRPAVGARWLQTQIAEANRVFAPTGVSFESLGTSALHERHARLRTRNHRHQLGRHLERAVVNVFVVASMVDVSDQATPRRGVHWRLPWQANRHFVVLTSIGPRTTLAHELGHYFGNQFHTTVAGNIMSYDHGPSPSFSRVQESRVVNSVRRALRSHQLLSSGRWRELEGAGRMPQFFYPERRHMVPASLRHR